MLINLKILTNAKEDHPIEEFDTLLRSKAVHDLHDQELTIYDLIASDILQKCPDTTQNDKNPWFNTMEGKIAINFFTMFGKQHTFLYNSLPPSFDLEQAKTKIKSIQEYINNNKAIKHEDSDKFKTYIFDKIKSTYITTSADTSDYACLHKNRYISHTYEWVYNFIHARIRDHVLLKYICTLAVLEDYDTMI